MFTLRLLGGLSLEDGSGVVAGRAAQRRRLALLALLACAPARTLSRDKLIGYLWPETDAEQGRHLLSVSLYEIRKALGEGALLSRGDDVTLGAELVATDVEQFDAALRAASWEAAVALYRGPFLDGFFLSDAVELERWVELERARLDLQYREALERLAEERSRAQDLRGAAEAWQRLAALDPANARVTLQLMRALAAAGDRARALQQARVHELLLQEEFGMEPDREVLALAEQLRRDPVPEPAAAAPAPAPLPAAVAEPSLPAGSAEELPRPAPPTPPPSARPRPRWPRLRFALGGLALIIGLWIVATNQSLVSAGTEPASIAVLPFADDSEEQGHEYFSDGLTEEIINALARVEGVKVAARTSSFAFKGQQADSREVAERLRVGSVLEGSVRKAGDRLRVTVRLVDVRSGYALWSESYDRRLDDVIRVQDDIAQSVVRALKGELVGSDSAVLSRRATPDLVAYDLYLKGRSFWYRRTGDGFAEALRHFQQAVARDSLYAPAYVGIADVYRLLSAYNYGLLPPAQAYPRAKAALQRALALDPNSAEAVTGMANVYANYEWDWGAAERAYQQAIELNPGYTPALHWYALLLQARGRQEEAIAAIRRARELDPLSLVMSTGMGQILYFARQPQRSIAEYRRALEMDSTFVTGHLGLGLAYMQAGLVREAIHEYETASRLLGQPVAVVEALRAHGYARAGRTDEARSILARLLARARSGYVPPEYLSLIYLGLNEHDAALDWLEKAYQNRSDALIFLRVEPLLDPLRDHPRFIALVRKVGV